MNYRKDWGRYLIVIEVVALILVLIYGAFSIVAPAGKSLGKSAEATYDSEMVYSMDDASDAGTDGNASIADIDTQIEPMIFSDEVNANIESMSVEQKVCQLFITRPEEITGVTEFTQAGEKTKNAMNQYPLGGFIFSDINFKGTTATRNMMANIQQYANEQQGMNMFLAVNNADNTVQFMTDDYMNMSIGISSDVVSEYTNAGIYTALTGFPGEDVTDITALSDQTAGMVASGTTFVVVDNSTCEALTGDASAPCSTSANSVGYLRNNAGFSGLIMTSDLAYGLPDGYSASDASVEAIKSGVSIVWVSTGFLDCYNAVLTAAQNGDISEDTLNQAVGRILTYKMS